MTPECAQGLSKPGASMVQVRTGRSLGNPEHLADFCVLEAFHVVEDDHRPLPIPKRGKRLIEEPAQLIRFAGVPERGRHGIGEGIGVADLLAPRDIQGRVGDNPVQPGPEGLIRNEPAEGAVGVEEALLHGVLGVLVREDNGACDGIRPPLVGADEGREGLGVTALGGEDVALLDGTVRRLTHQA